MSYYVSMHDKFLSGWGEAADRINIYLIRCETLPEAQAAANAALKRDEMDRITIHPARPKFNTRRYYVSEIDYAKLGPIWKETQQ